MSTASSNPPTTAACSARHEWGRHPWTAPLASMRPEKQRGPRSQEALLGPGRLQACVPAGLRQVTGQEQLRGFGSSPGAGCLHCVQSNRRCLLSPQPPCCPRRQAWRGCLYRCPPPGYCSAGAMSHPFPWRVWRHLASCPKAPPAPGPPGWAQPQLRPAAPAAFPAPCRDGGGSCPRDGGFAASCGERGQRRLGQGCAGACPALAVGRGTVGGRQGEGLSQGPR